MKKVFDSFYVFSKFSLSFILLLCVFFLVYLLRIFMQDDSIASLGGGTPRLPPDQGRHPAGGVHIRGSGGPFVNRK